MRGSGEGKIISLFIWVAITSNGVFSNQATNWDITFLLNRNFGLTSINSDLEFPIEIEDPKNDILYSVPAYTLFPNGNLPEESLYIQINFQPKSLTDEYYFIAIRDPDMVLRFSLSLAKKDMYRVSLKYHPVESAEGEKEIQFPVPSAQDAWRLGVLLEKTQIKFFTSCPQTQPVAFHIEENVNLLGVKLFMPGASAYLLNSGLKSSPSYFNGILTEFGFHSGKNLDKINCQSTNMVEGSGELMYTFDPEFGNIIVTQVAQEVSTTSSPHHPMISTELYISDNNLSSQMSTDELNFIPRSRDPMEFVPYIDLSNFVLRIYDLKENRLLTDSKVENGNAYFSNGTSISLTGVPGFQMNNENAEVLLSIDVFTENTTSLVDIASGQTLIVKKFTEGIPIDLMRKYANKVMFEIILDTGTMQVDTYSGRWIIQDTTTGEVNEIKDLRDGFFILDNDKAVIIPRLLQSDEEFLAIEASTGKVGRFDQIHGKIIANIGDGVTEYPSLSFSTTSAKKFVADLETRLSTHISYIDPGTMTTVDSVNEVNKSNGSTIIPTDEKVDDDDKILNFSSLSYPTITDHPSTLTSVIHDINITGNPSASIIDIHSTSSSLVATTSSILEDDITTIAKSTTYELRPDDYPTKDYLEMGASADTQLIKSSSPRPTTVHIATNEQDVDGARITGNETVVVTESIVESSSISSVSDSAFDDYNIATLPTPTTDILPLFNVTDVTFSVNDANSIITSDFIENLVTHFYDSEENSTATESVDESKPIFSTLKHTEPTFNNTVDFRLNTYSTLSYVKNTDHQISSLSATNQLENTTQTTIVALPSTTESKDTLNSTTSVDDIGNDLSSSTSQYTGIIDKQFSTIVSTEETTTTLEVKDSIFPEVRSSRETTVDPVYLSGNQSSKDILKPDCYCLEEFLNSEKIDQFKGPTGPKGEKGEPGVPGQNGTCPYSCEALLTPELLKKLTALKEDESPPNSCNDTGTLCAEKATNTSCKLDVDDPRILEMLKNTVSEYFKSPEVLKRLQIDTAKDRDCSCPTKEKTDSYGSELIAADIMDSLRKISYGAIVMENESSLAKVAYSMPIGVMVYLKNEDKFYLKTQEEDNIWRIIRMGPTSEGKMIPKPVMSKTTPPPQSEFPEISKKKLYLVAQSETFNGELRYRAKLEGGHSGALFICQREASSTNLSQPFYPLLNTDMFNLEYVVPPMHRFKLPLINLRGEKIFDDFYSLIRGKQKPKAPIYSFDGKDINEDELSSCIWLGEKPVYQSGEYEQVARSKCRNWQTSYPSEKATAARVPVLTNATGLLHQSNLFEESCSKRCHVLCIQILPS